MYYHWKKKTQSEIKAKVFGALSNNVNYTEQCILGIPASYLDEKVFSQDETFLKEAPFLSTLITNPNHIGCHTLGSSERFFSGTQRIEKELLDVCAIDILGAKPESFDGYVASGGTEANIQAIWIYRNYFQKEYGASLDEIAILCSADSHYSMDKAGNLLMLSTYKVKVAQTTRELHQQEISRTIDLAKSDGAKYFITVSNMMTTMFGSVDDVDQYIDALTDRDVKFKIHIDAAYGGFYYPFSNEDSQLSFQNEHISSVTLDAHKMAQAPYGTGIFLARKGFIDYANTREASYVEGEDYTLSGSRSGANAIAVWMILMKNGPFGWKEKVFILQKRTDWLCEELRDSGIAFYRNPFSNIVAIDSEYITLKLANEFGLVPDNHLNPKWFKIVLMEHVTIEKLIKLLNRIKQQQIWPQIQKK